MEVWNNQAADRDNTSADRVAILFDAFLRTAVPTERFKTRDDLYLKELFRFAELSDAVCEFVDLANGSKSGATVAITGKHIFLHLFESFTYKSVAR